MLGDINKLFVFKSLLTMPIDILPLHLMQTFLPIIWIFTEGEGDGIKFRLPFKIFSTLMYLSTLAWLGLKIQLLPVFLSNIIFVLILLWSLVIHIWLRVTVQASAYYPTLYSPWNKQFTHNSRHQAKMGLVISVFFILASPFYFCFMIRILQGASIMNVSSSLFLLLISVQRGAEVKV